MPLMSEVVRNNTAASQFEIFLDDKRVGLLRYVDNAPRTDSSQRIMFHTEIDEAYGGQGLAGALVRQALEATRLEGFAVVAVCPYVKTFASARPEYADLVVPASADALSLIKRGA